MRTITFNTARQYENGNQVIEAKIGKKDEYGIVEVVFWDKSRDVVGMVIVINSDYIKTDIMRDYDKGDYEPLSISEYENWRG